LDTYVCRLAEPPAAAPGATPRRATGNAAEEATTREYTPVPSAESTKSTEPPARGENAAVDRHDRHNPAEGKPKTSTEGETGSARGSKKDPDQNIDGANGSGVGGKHAEGNVKNATSVTDIKTKLNNEAAAANH
jgi:hypothetical protein